MNVTDIAAHREPVIVATEALELAIADAVRFAVNEVGITYFVYAVCHREEQQQMAA